MKKKQAKRGSMKYVILLLAVLVCIPAGGMIARAALENDNNTGVRSVKGSTLGEIEDSTLVIGSHLIHIRGLTETLYGIALESANEFSQHALYYKSELADGQWFEISDASSIADITTEGMRVDKSVIDALEFTHRTDANGVTTDLRSGQTVSVFDIQSPYDLNSMAELEPVRTQYEVISEKEKKSDSDKKYIGMIRELFESDVRSEDCISCDGDIEALERYKSDLIDREASAAWIDTVDGVTESVDAKRRVMAYDRLTTLLDGLLERAEGPAVEASEETGGDEEEADSNLVVNSEVVLAIGDSVNQVESSRSACEAKLLTEGSTVVSKYGYDFTNDLINCVNADDYSNSDTLAAQLCALNNIVQDKIVDPETEESLLDTYLIPTTEENYENALKAGVSDDYVKAVAGGASAANADGILKSQQEMITMLGQEYQMMLEAKYKHVPNADAQKDVLDRLEKLSKLSEDVQADDSYQYMMESINALSSWMKECYGGLVADGNVDSEMQMLQDKKDELKRQYEDALDQQDYKREKELGAQLQAVQSDIENLEKDYLAIINSPNSSEADKAKATAGLGKGTSASAIDQIAETFLDALNDATGSGTVIDDESQRLLDELDSRLAALEELAKLNPDAAAGALGSINEALKNSTALPDSEKALMQSAVADLQTQVGEAANNSKGATMPASAAKELLDSVLKNLLAADYENISVEQKAAALLALEWYGKEMRNQNIAALAASLANEQAEGNSRYLFRKFTAKPGNFVSLHTIGKIVNYRVIFDDRHLSETLKSMEDAASYDTFVYDRKMYEMNGKTSKEMTCAAGFQDQQLYIASADAKNIFSLEAEAIDQAEYGVAYTAEMKTLATEILKGLQEGGR